MSGKRPVGRTADEFGRIDILVNKCGARGPREGRGRLGQVDADDQHNIDVKAIAQGALKSRMLDDVLAARPDRVEHGFSSAASSSRNILRGTGLERAETLAVFLAPEASRGFPGRLISAVWDWWENWPEHVGGMRTTDEDSLGRIIGRERGFSWRDK